MEGSTITILGCISRGGIASGATNQPIKYNGRLSPNKLMIGKGKINYCWQRP